MEFKVCSKCEEEFPATTEFFHKGNGKFGLRPLCKECRNQYERQYYQNNKEKVYQRTKRWCQNNKELCRARDKRHRQTERAKELVREYRRSEKGKLVAKKYAQSEKGRERRRMLGRKYQKSEKRKIINKRYAQSEKGKQAKKKANKKRYESNKLSICISGRMGRSLRSNKANRHWEDLVDYNLGQLKTHIENLFQLGMSWDNYGLYGWHIDHKIPISAFNITSYTCENFQRCWALENLQPLWAGDNIRKSNKMEEKECF